MPQDDIAPASSANAFGIPSAADIRSLTEERKRLKAAEEARERALLDEEEKHRKDLFFSRKLTPEVVDRIMRRVRTAAENGQSELLLGHFPSAWCTDHGRKINVREDGWPDTLQGMAREFYEFWDANLKASGFHIAVEIISFPDGMPGEVGVTLSWSA
ncbi:hypothetical protein [Azospirillum doebereinerae]|uniref:Uncharacterized protein n=2 Tax=Azospirillum doebereinerae TaxID=92933 RepID=A0A3S0UZV3_9PROT|nr:hypothetical protein [Azospirillum doebereinerae]MCG5240328.1 hypothetical protein [Azospirillum doebereinerae]RUQ67778.1 hypothetical protein EJ913_19060 [Azospirillum doebereinerae]